MKLNFSYDFLVANRNNKTINLQNLCLGILGDGQLARMTALECHPLGITPIILSQDSQSPAAQVSSRVIKGSIQNGEDVKSLVSQVDYLTFESEFVPRKILQMLKEELKESRVQVFPPIEILEKIQDREEQKTLLDLYMVPTSPWLRVRSIQDLEQAEKVLGSRLVLKKTFGGYDGNGTFVLKTKSDRKKFIETTLNKNFTFIAEKWIPFKRELALIMGRDRSGQIFHFPLVQTQQKENRCDWVAGPMKHKRLNSVLQKMKKLLSQENYVGVLGIELFDTGDSLLVNELAPRVHNSGHYTQESCSISQFKAHLLCGIMKIPKIDLLAPAFVMTNIVGESEGPIQISEGLTGSIHLYGKIENRKGRKMGHINYIGRNLNALLKLALKERTGIRK
jgi:phosphoribosylaminoimidazole carboxylase PurK protein